MSAAGQRAALISNPTGKKVDGMGWTTKEWEFDAVDSQTTLEFYTLEKKERSPSPARLSTTFGSRPLREGNSCVPWMFIFNGDAKRAG